MRGKQNAKKEANGQAQIGLSGSAPGVLPGETARVEGENGPARSGDDSPCGRCVPEGKRGSAASFIDLNLQVWDDDGRRFIAWKYVWNLPKGASK